MKRAAAGARGVAPNTEAAAISVAYVRDCAEALVDR
jgi:hypothetical protein